jgi:plasmid stabilization system protein ParE
VPQLKISAKARDDIVRLHAFLAAKDTSVAGRAVDEIKASLFVLTQMPKMGRLVETGLRELVIDFGSSAYLALYALDEVLDEVVVLALRHQRELDYK